MANIVQFIQRIHSAIYGEEVRGSICDALNAMNTETESYVEQAAAQVELATQQAENASTSATASAGSATNSANSAITSESWAVGGTGTREGEDTNNAKYWCEQAREAGGDVTGVKGNEETEYRTGNVNLTCEDIGAATAEDMEQAQDDITQLNQSLTYHHIPATQFKNVISFADYPNWTEVNIDCRFGLNNQYGASFHIVRDNLNNSTRRYLGGGFISSSDFHFLAIEVSPNGCVGNIWNYSGSDVSTNSATTIECVIR